MSRYPPNASVTSVCARRRRELNHNNSTPTASSKKNSVLGSSSKPTNFFISYMELCLVSKLAKRRDRVREPDIAADNRAFADHRVAAENRGAGIDHDIVFNCRVALAAANQTA